MFNIWLTVVDSQSTIIHFERCFFLLKKNKTKEKNDFVILNNKWIELPLKVEALIIPILFDRHY